MRVNDIGNKLGVIDRALTEIYCLDITPVKHRLQQLTIHSFKHVPKEINALPRHGGMSAIKARRLMHGQFLYSGSQQCVSKIFH